MEFRGAGAFGKEGRRRFWKGQWRVRTPVSPLGARRGGRQSQDKSSEKMLRTWVSDATWDYPWWLEASVSVGHPDPTSPTSL